MDDSESSGGSFGFIGEGGVTFALGSGFVLNFRTGDPRTEQTEKIKADR